MGVRFFFVISGFLITWLMLREFSTRGSVNLTNFYIRRGFRILPVYIIYILACVIFGAVSGRQLDGAHLLAVVTFTGNYLTLSGPIDHLWSLAVEEQFYLIWPVTCVFGGLLARPKAALGVLCATCVFCPVFRGVQYIVGKDTHFLFHHFSFLATADEIAIGCAASLLLWRRADLWRFLCERQALVMTIGLMIFFALRPLSAIPGSLLISVPLGPTFQAVGFTLVLLATIAVSHSTVGRFLNWRPVAWIGILSYSIYIWHGLWSPAHAGWVPGLSFVNNTQGLWMAASLLTAVISYYAFEKPFINLKKRFTSHD